MSDFFNHCRGKIFWGKISCSALGSFSFLPVEVSWLGFQIGICPHTWHKRADEWITFFALTSKRVPSFGLKIIMRIFFLFESSDYFCLLGNFWVQNFEMCLTTLQVPVPCGPFVGARVVLLTLKVVTVLSAWLTADRTLTVFLAKSVSSTCVFKIKLVSFVKCSFQFESWR